MTEQQEWKAFEAWTWTDGCTDIEEAWRVWQAHAALSAQPEGAQASVADAEEVLREVIADAELSSVEASIAYEALARLVVLSASPQAPAPAGVREGGNV
jgi:hypothetical protein